MKEQRKKSLVGPLLPFVLSSLLLVVLLCGLSRATEAEPGVPPAAASRGISRLSSLEYQTDVPVCHQTRNLVPNPGFERGGEPWADHWNDYGPCLFSYDDPGPNSDHSALINASSSRDTACTLFTRIEEISVEPDRFYDYSAMIRANLTQGDAYLRITFWSWQDDPPGWKYEGEARTASVTDTGWVWAQATGSVQAPAAAEYARVHAVLPKSSTGSVWFDDVSLGLATCLDVSKRDDPDPVSPGEMLTYTIAFSNTGREKATDVEIIETYDEDVDFEWAQPPPSKSNNHWEIPELPPGASGTITVVVHVEDGAEERVSLVNCVDLYSDEIEKLDYTCISTRIITDGCAIHIYPPEAEKTVEPGDAANHYLTLYNVGTCDGQAYLTYTSSQGWDVAFALSMTYTLPSERSSGEVMVSPLVPRDALSGTVDITSITATLVCSLPCNTTATATATLTTTVTAIPLTDVVISGPETGATNSPYTFTATVSPITATQPVTFSWQAKEQSDVVTNTYALSHTVVFTWQAPGTHIITVTATNAGGTVTDTHLIAITPSSPTVYLPLALCCCPLIPPVLETIENDDIDGSYTVCWSHLCDVTFVLEEATDSAFADATEIYSGTKACYHIDGRSAGQYYYRVKACDGRGCSGWSNTEEVGAWWEQEDNDSCSKANGLLVFSEYYYGYPDDQYDCFKIHPDRKGQVTMKLENHAGPCVNLLLYHQSEANPVCRVTRPPYELTCDVISGTYCITIRTDQGHHRDTPYKLRATFR